MSWEQLLSVYKIDAAQRAYWNNQPPRACPNDGTPLQPSPEGYDSTLFCPHDGWQYPRDWTRPE